MNEKRIGGNSKANVYSHIFKQNMFWETWFA